MNHEHELEDEKKYLEEKIAAGGDDVEEVGVARPTLGSLCQSGNLTRCFKPEARMWMSFFLVANPKIKERRNPFDR